MDFIVSVLGALYWLVILAVPVYCAYWAVRAVLEGSRLERALLLLGGLCVVAACLIPASVGRFQNAVPMPVFITADWVVWAALGLAATAFGALAISSWRNGRRRGLRAALLILVISAPLSACARFIADPAPWQAYTTLDHPNGSRYAFVESSFLQGQLLAIARVESQHWYGTEYTALVVTNGDSPRSYVSLVRADGSDESGFCQLLLAPDGRVLAVRSLNHLYMAFDPRSGEHWSHDAIYALSPFLMLDARSQPSQKDLALIDEELRDLTTRAADDRSWLVEALARGDISGIPAPKHLEAAATHANPAVRVAAAQLLSKLHALTTQQL